MVDTAPPKKKRRGGRRRKTGWYTNFKARASFHRLTDHSDTCKRRHIRCDEEKPICRNCARLDLSCQQNNAIREIDHEVLGQERPAQDLQVPQDKGKAHCDQVPSSTLDIFRSHLNGLDQLMEFTPSDIDLATPISILPPTTANGSSSPERVSLNSESAFLLQTFVKTVATWMDLFDHSRTYQLKVPQLALASPLLFHCVCAFTANHLALSNISLNASWKLVAVRHYGQALRLLIDVLEVPFCETAMTGIMLLLSYEVHGAIRSEDYRRHFLGLTVLIKSHGITAQSTGTDRANFWIYCRHEIAVALANERPLVLNPNEWGVSWQEGEMREDVLGNQLMWILARIISLVFGPDGERDTGQVQRESFVRELESWRSGLSECFIGIPYGDADDDGFCKIYFTVTAAAAAAFWYHIAHILLYAEPALQNESYVPLIQDQAIRITNITISDFPAALKVFSTHGLYYAAKHIRGVSQKARVWNVLKDIETDTGYHTRSTVKNLQAQVEKHNES